VYLRNFTSIVNPDKKDGKTCLKKIKNDKCFSRCIVLVVRLKNKTKITVHFNILRWRRTALKLRNGLPRWTVVRVRNSLDSEIREPIHSRYLFINLPHGNDFFCFRYRSWSLRSSRILCVRGHSQCCCRIRHLFRGSEQTATLTITRFPKIIPSNSNR